MSNRDLMIMGVVAAVMLSLAVVQSRIMNRKMGKASGKGYLIQGLATDDVDVIVLGTSTEEVRLKRQNQSFVITSKDNYPAQFKNINELIRNCLEIETTELITSSTANHEDLEVTEEKGRYVVKFLNQDQEVITGVVIGKYAEQGSGSYVRLIGSDDVYLTETSPYLQTGASAFYEQNLLSVEQDKIIQVQVFTTEDGYTLVQEPNETFVLAVAAGESSPKLNQSTAQSVFTALSSLYVDDVQSAASAESLDFETTYRCRLDDSTTYTLQVAQQEDKYYLKCSAFFAAQPPVKTASETEEEHKEKVAQVLSAQEAAQKFSTQHKNWVYEVASWKGENLVKALADLIEHQ